MITIFLFLFILIVKTTFAQYPEIIWQQCYGGSEWDFFYNSDILLLEDGYAFISTTFSNDGQVSNFHGNSDIWFVRTDFDGNIVFERCYGGSNFDYSHRLISSNDGGFILVGATASNDGDVTINHGGMDYWVIKIDFTGNIIWQKCYGGSSNDEPYDIIETDNNEFIINGYTVSSNGDVSYNNGYYDMWVIKIDQQGILLWEKCFGGSITDNGYLINRTDDGGYLLGGSVSSTDGNVTCTTHGGFDAWLIKLSSGMEVEWQKCYGGTYDDNFIKIINNNNGFMLAGLTHSNDGDVSGFHGIPGDDPDIWLAKVNETGELQWQRCLGGGGWEVTGNLVKNEDDEIFLIGSSNSFTGDLQDCNHQTTFPLTFDGWVVKLTDEGETIWNRCLGSDVVQDAFDAVFPSENYITVLGGTAPVYSGWEVNCDIHGSYDVWVVELADTLTTTNEPLLYDEIKVYPNPAKDYVIFETSESGIKGTVILMNVFGEEIVKKELSSGKNVFDIRGVDSGVYFYRIETENYFYNGEIVILK